MCLLEEIENRIKLRNVEGNMKELNVTTITVKEMRELLSHLDDNDTLQLTTLTMDSGDCTMEEVKKVAAMPILEQGKTMVYFPMRNIGLGKIDVYENEQKDIYNIRSSGKMRSLAFVMRE